MYNKKEEENNPLVAGYRKDSDIFLNHHIPGDISYYCCICNARCVTLLSGIITIHGLQDTGLFILVVFQSFDSTL